ncbi:MAG: MBL fold metallo-hydrolase [Bdellovibrionota bacterium]
MAKKVIYGESQDMELIFRQFRSEGGCNSFIFADAKTRQACIIDPRADEVDSYESFVHSRKLDVRYAIDTHTHADHYSGTHLIADRLGAAIVMSAQTKSARPSLKLKDGQTLELSSGFAIEALYTPGHTPDSVSFLFRGDWGSAVFTGDTLFIGSSGRTDFPEADASEQYESIYNRLGKLEDSTWVLPGHDYSNLLFSTIGCEKKTNPHYLFADKEAFVRMKKTEALEVSGVVPHIVEFNLHSKPSNRPRSGAHTMCSSGCVAADATMARNSVAEFSEALRAEKNRGALFLDVREPEELKMGFIPGTENLPLSELFMHWRELQSASKVYITCQRGNRSQFAAQTLMRLGLRHVVNVDGGFLAWAAAQLPIQRS